MSNSQKYCAHRILNDIIIQHNLSQTSTATTVSGKSR